MNLGDIKVLTFDCYGTLIDWESGILGALRDVLGGRGIERSDDELLALFAAVESPIQQEEFRSYREVLDLTMAELTRRLGFEPTEQEKTALSGSLPRWKPFPDTVAALGRLAARFDLGVISNVDDDLFAGSAAQLQAPFKWVITAQQVGSYKPSTNNFLVALERIGRPKEQILHCAQSLFHDVAPARSLGLATAWVERPSGRKGSAAPPSDARPDLTVRDLATLADTLLA